MTRIAKSNYYILFVTALFLAGDLHSQQLKIGLFPDDSIQSLVFSVVKGEYELFLDDSLIGRAGEQRIFYLTLTPDGAILSDGHTEYGGFGELLLTGLRDANIFQLKPVDPSLYSADFDDDLSIKQNKGKFTIINLPDVNKYIAGVIEAEGGASATDEYYKAQAILVRTYALKNIYRHGADGFDLCNTEHCQAYKGRSLLNKKIHDAVESTEQLVLTDSSRNLITAPYHSNCGGNTSTADMAWQNKLPCLYSINDPFCTESKNAGWSRNIPLNDWKEYLRTNGFSNEDLKQNNMQYSRDHREKIYISGKSSIPFRKLREDFALKSAYFAVEINGRWVILKGKGFGHGVGLCQEGAMEMSRVGYTFVDILHFYFQNILIQDYSSIMKQ